MTHEQPEARSVALSTRMYAAMLRAYPAAFRAEYAEPMAQLFRDSCRRADRQGGLAALSMLWVKTLVDYARTTLEEHIDGGVQVTRDTFVKLCGWALPVGAVALFLGILANDRPPYDPSNMASLPVDRLANAADIFLLVFGFLLCALGMVGLMVRYGEAAGAWARFGLGAGAASGLVAALGVVIGGINPEPAVAWPMFFLGMTFMFTGLLVFGVACIRRKPLPRWNALPLLTGVWLPTGVLLGALAQAITGSGFEIPAAVGVPLVIVSLGGLALLGYLLLTDSRAVEPNAA